MDADEVRDVVVDVERLVDEAGRVGDEATRRRTSRHRSSVHDETVLEDAPAVDETRLLEDDAGIERTVAFLNDLVERRGLSRGDAWVCACRALSRVVERCERETRKRRRDDEAPRTTTTTRDVDILRSIRRAVLVVGKLFRHHEEVEGAAPPAANTSWWVEYTSALMEPSSRKIGAIAAGWAAAAILVASVGRKR